MIGVTADESARVRGPEISTLGQHQISVLLKLLLRLLVNLLQSSGWWIRIGEVVCSSTCGFYRFLTLLILILIIRNSFLVFYLFAIQIFTHHVFLVWRIISFLWVFYLTGSLLFILILVNLVDFFFRVTFKLMLTLISIYILVDTALLFFIGADFLHGILCVQIQIVLGGTMDLKLFMCIQIVVLLCFALLSVYFFFKAVFTDLFSWIQLLSIKATLITISSLVELLLTSSANRDHLLLSIRNQLLLTIILNVLFIISDDTLPLLLPLLLFLLLLQAHHLLLVNPLSSLFSILFYIVLMQQRGL